MIIVISDGHRHTQWVGLIELNLFIMMSAPVLCCVVIAAVWVIPLRSSLDYHRNDFSVDSLHGFMKTRLFVNGIILYEFTRGCTGSGVRTWHHTRTHKVD